MSNQMPNEVWGVIAYPIVNFYGFPIAVSQ